MTLLNWSHGLPNCTTDMLEHRVTTASLYTVISCNTYCLVNLPMLFIQECQVNVLMLYLRRTTRSYVWYTLFWSSELLVSHINGLISYLTMSKHTMMMFALDHENCQAYEYTVSKRLTSIPNKLFFIFVWAKMANSYVVWAKMAN